MGNRLRVGVLLVLALFFAGCQAETIQPSATNSETSATKTTTTRAGFTTATTAPFNASALSPVISNVRVLEVGISTAKVSWTVDSKTKASWLAYDLHVPPNGGSETFEGSGDKTVSLSNLQPGSTYYFQVVARDALARYFTESPIQNFTTRPAPTTGATASTTTTQTTRTISTIPPPSSSTTTTTTTTTSSTTTTQPPTPDTTPPVITGEAHSVSGNTATISWSVTDNNPNPPRSQVQYGRTSDYGTNVPTLSSSAALGSGARSQPLTGLLWGATYHYQIYAEDAATPPNTDDSDSDRTFTVPGLAVSVASNSFTPSSASVASSSAVTWNLASGFHSVTIKNPSGTQIHDEDISASDPTVTFTFSATGTYEVYCKYHGGMTSTVTVA